MDRDLVDLSESHEIRDWFVHAFTSDYLYLYAHRSEEEAEDHVTMAIRHLPFRPGQHVLDIACGAGRHLLAFARRGARVTGVDLSPVLLENARQRFRALGLRGEFIQLDMRELNFGAAFDGVTMWFTSFGYFEKRSDDMRVLANLSHALKSDGWWWIDLPNPAYLKAHLVTHSLREINGPHGRARVEEKRRLLGERVVKRITIVDERGERTYMENVRLYAPEVFAEMIAAVNLASDGVLGDYDGSQFSRSSPRQIWFGRKLK